MKKERTFLKPEAELVDFGKEDIITSSGENVGNTGYSALPEWPNQDQ